MLGEIRSRIPPKIPHILQDLAKVHLYQESVVRSKLGTSQPLKPLRLGVVFSGGQAAGGHNVVAALFDALSGGKLFGFLDGPSGILQGKSKELTQEMIAPYRNQGGFDLLGSGRKRIDKEEDFKAAQAAVQKLNLDGLVVVGGDDSNTNAALLAEYFQKAGCKTRVIGVPKTIDGDLQNSHVPISFGFDTATKIYSELIGNLARDALSDKKYTHFIKLMGRTASHVTLECALTTHPNLALIGEERKPLTHVVGEIADLVIKRAEMGKNYGVILIPEGIVEFIPDLQKEAPELAWDAHGNINLSAIETDLFLIQRVTAELAKRGFSGKFSPVRHFFGYEGRAGFPTNFDANYCYALGLAAALLIAHNFTGMMAFIEGLKNPVEEWTIGGVPLASLITMEKRKGEMKPVIAKTLVDLKGKSYLTYQKHKAAWALGDDYRFPGPIQFFGDPQLTDGIPLILDNS
jgi:pyrophosphate--fructose-6-phosphate 1-phosphotransferase